MKTTDRDRKIIDTQRRRRASGTFLPDFIRFFRRIQFSVQSACNMVVIKSLTGMAQAVCAAMDSLHWEGIVGTLAGDDTIFVVTKDEDCARRFTEELRHMLG